MSYNEQNLLAFIVFAVSIAIIYKDKPQNASVIIIAAFLYAFFAGHLPIQLEAFQ